MLTYPCAIQIQFPVHSTLQVITVLLGPRWLIPRMARLAISAHPAAIVRQAPITACCVPQGPTLWLKVGTDTRPWHPYHWLVTCHSSLMRICFCFHSNCSEVDPTKLCTGHDSCGMCFHGSGSYHGMCKIFQRLPHTSPSLINCRYL